MNTTIEQESKYGKFARDYYIKIDRIVDDFLKSVDEDTSVMVISDHGFCPVQKEVIVNNYLEELGFLKVKNGSQIDLEKSRAVSYGYGDVWLNVEGREPKGLIAPGEEYEETRNDIMEELRKISIDDEKPFKDVKKREDVYWGSHLGEAPDLTIIFNVGWQAARRPEIMEKKESKRYVNEHPRWSGGHDGTHDPMDVPGIIGILGPGILGGKEVRARLWDLAPTILNLMNILIPNDMDGKPMPITKTKR